MTRGWGYGVNYYNPYCATPAVVAVAPYDYSQPVIVNNYITSDADATGEIAAATPTETSPALQLFDDGLAQFKTGDYRQSVGRFDEALKQMPGDPVIHEVRALALYAVGDYAGSAAALNSLLTSAPGMDWTTMSGLYGNIEDYTRQLRQLEKYCTDHPKDPAAAFVLAYHYLVTGAKDAAIGELKVVVANEPKDVTARRMLEALVPVAPPAPSAPAVWPSPAPLEEGGGRQTDLVGTWRAQAGGTSIELKIGEDSQFAWTATETGKPPIKLEGQLRMADDGIVLESADKGSMAGTVQSSGPDQWQFTLSGAPPSEPGLSFARVK